jgi:hypothetical protein
MKKSLFMILSLVVISVFLFGCVREEISDEELEAELSELSEEELDQAIEAVESEDTGDFVGEAYRLRSNLRDSKRISKVRFLKVAYREKINKVYLSLCDTKCMDKYGTNGVCGGEGYYLGGSSYCEDELVCACSPATCNSDHDCKDKYPRNKCVNKECNYPRCTTKCMDIYGTGGICGGNEGDPQGSAYCPGSEQCVCLPPTCNTDDECKSINSKFKCINDGCRYPRCDDACKDFFGYSGGACGASEGEDHGSAFCGLTFEQCMCY